jgi:hypothetical protein
MTTVLLDPPNELLRIDRIWLFISVDDDGNEGVCAASLAGPGSLIPLIAADEERLESLRGVATEIAVLSGKTVRLLKFTVREEVEVIAP